MKDLIGEKAKLHIVKNGQDLFYTAVVVDVTDQHITFVDKYNNKYVFLLEYVKEATCQK